METYTAIDLPALKIAATSILDQLKNTERDEATVLTLTGDLGAGKTAFVQQLGALLGVRESIVSPTFVVMKQYETADAAFSTLVHIDAYRLADESETIPLHLDDLLKQPRTLICIEWAELIPTALPSHHAALTIIDEAGSRTLRYTYGH